jgi:type I restriction enzyme, S subunit
VTDLTTRLGDHVDILSGFAFKSAQFNTEGDGLPLIRIRDVVTGSSSTYFSGDYPEQYLINDGDLLIGMDGDFNRETWNGGTALLNQRVCRILSNGESLDQRYLYHFLPSELLKIHASTPAVTVKHLAVKVIEAIQIPFPPLEEQKRIAAILDKADAIRRKRQHAIELADQFLGSVFLDMFGDPVTNPKGFPKLTIGEVATNCDSKRVPIKQEDRDMRPGSYPYYGSVGIIDDIDDYLYEGEHLLISEDGKHLVNRNRPIACMADGKFWVNNHAHVLKFNGVIDLQYLAAAIEMMPIRPFVTGIDQFKLNRTSMDRIPIVVPPVSLQKKYREIVAKVGCLKARMDDGADHCKSNKGSLTKLAFNGELKSTAVA